MIKINGTQLYTEAEVAKMCKVTAQKVAQNLRTGGIVGEIITIEAKIFMISANEVKAYKARLKTGISRTEQEEKGKI